MRRTTTGVDEADDPSGSSRLWSDGAHLLIWFMARR